MPHNVGVKVAVTHLGQGVFEKSVLGGCDAPHIRGQFRQTRGNGVEYSDWRGKFCHPERLNLECLPPPAIQPWMMPALYVNTRVAVVHRYKAVYEYDNKTDA